MTIPATPFKKANRIIDAALAREVSGQDTALCWASNPPVLPGYYWVRILYGKSKSAAVIREFDAEAIIRVKENIAEQEKDPRPRRVSAEWAGPIHMPKEQN